MNIDQMPPPANQRCQIYTQETPDDDRALDRCTNQGTHWVKWSGCECIDESSDDCMEDFLSWECDTHDAEGAQT